MQERNFSQFLKEHNSKMSAFDLNVLIRLKNITNYQPENIEHLDDKRYINNADKKILHTIKI